MTIGQIMDRMSAVLKSDTPQADADRLMRELLDVSARAYADVGYLAGYFSDDDAARIYKLFRTAHPVFGTTRPTPEQALEAGRRIGEAQR